MKILKKKKINFSRRVYLVLACFFLGSYCFSGSGVIFAQNFELVDKETYEEYYKKPLYVPDVRFSGEYQYNALNFEDFAGNRHISSWQGFELRLRSEVKENLKLNLLFTNEPYEWGETKEVYRSRGNGNRQNQARQNIGISLREFYLEYNSNPHAIFRAGRQPISLGDKLGLIYEGEADAFTISCRIGTWCLEAGQANFGGGIKAYESYGITTWLEFFYPVYESEETIENYWIDNEEKKRKHSRLDVDIYRIDDKQDRVAVTSYGGRTHNPYQNSVGDIVYSPDHLQVGVIDDFTLQTRSFDFNGDETIDATNDILGRDVKAGIENSIFSEYATSSPFDINGDGTFDNPNKDEFLFLIRLPVLRIDAIDSYRSISVVKSNNKDISADFAFDLPLNLERVYFDREQQTFGINIKWYAGNFGLLFHTAQNFGKKAYHYGGGDSDAVPGAERQTLGRFYRLEWQQLAGSSTQFGAVAFMASGGKANSNDDFPWSNNDGYFEWNKGTYGDALLYFGGKESYLGQAHSVNNLVYSSFYYKYHGAEQNIGGITRLFSFSRNEPVYNAAGKKVSYIGWEWDLEFYKYISDSLKISLEAAYFKPGNAYSPDDSTKPGVDPIPSNITQYNFKIEYKF